MSLRSPALPLIAFAAFVLIGGVGHGIYTNRWTESDTLQKSVSALNGIPKTAGDWQAAEVTHDPEDLARAGIRGSVFRSYQNKQTGATVTALLVCGRGGPISVHTPDVCYAGAGYRQAAPQARKVIKENGAAFWMAPFDKPDPLTPQRLNVTWGWSHDGAAWIAPDNPRTICAWQPALYKLYVVHSVPLTAQGEDGVVADFLADFLPVVRESLVSSP